MIDVLKQGTLVILTRELIWTKIYHEPIVTFDMLGTGELLHAGLFDRSQVGMILAVGDYHPDPLGAGSPRQQALIFTSALKIGWVDAGSLKLLPTWRNRKPREP